MEGAALMRRTVAIALMACLALCGCDGGNAVERKEDSPRDNVDGRYISDYGSDDFRTVVDSKTGITYLVWERPSGKSRVGGITPLLGKDGKPVMSEEVSE